MVRFVFLLLSIFLTIQVANAAAYIRTVDSGQDWRIGNDQVERRISFSAASGLQTEGLIYKPTGREFTAYGRSHHENNSEFSFKAGNQTLTGKSLVFTKAMTQDMPGGKALELEFKTKDAKIGVNVFYAAYGAFPALRKWIEIKNLGSEPLQLKNLAFESLTAAPGDPADLIVDGGYGGAYRDFYFTGRVSDNAVFIRNSRTKEGFAIVNEAPGYLKRTEIGSGWGEHFDVMYDTDLFPFEKTLAPRTAFTSAKSSLIFFQDGQFPSDSHWVVPSFAWHILTRRPIERGGTPWIYNTWEPFLRGIDAEKVSALAIVAREIGIDIFTIDDGWQAEYGSNDFDLQRFPGGFNSVHSTLEKNHLKLGLWVPLAAVSTKTADYKAHPEWICRDRNGAPKFTNTASGQQAVMCLGSAYRDAALKRLSDLIERYHPAYIKVDLTTVFNAYGEQPGCNAKGHYHTNWAESLQEIYAGLQYIGTNLYKQHPEVLVDYTFELWGEKHLIDAALTQVADLDWLSNVYDGSLEAGGPRQARQLLYDRAFSIPAETMLIGNLRASVQPVDGRIATETGSAPLLLGDLRELSEADRKLYRESIQRFKELRAHSNLLDSFFPLGHWRQPSETAWDGFARLSRDSDGIVSLFLNGSDVSSVDVRVVAPASAEYDVRSLLDGSNLGHVTGDELNRGWKVTIPPGKRVEVLELVRTHQN